MTIAEFHGKISSTGRNLHDQLEDLLTSDVFSACKYVRPQVLLLPYLRTACSLDGVTLSEKLPGTNITKATYLFWPRMNFSEPDLLILLEDEHAKYSIVMVEAKYFSGKSGGPLDEEDLQIASSPTDQLAREYQDLMSAESFLKIAPEKINHRTLVYVTAHRSFPKASISESINEITHFSPSSSPIELYWTSWFTLLPIITAEPQILDWESEILLDLQGLLEKKGFTFFHGISKLAVVAPMTDTPFYISRGGSISGTYDYALQDVVPLGVNLYTTKDQRKPYQWITGSIRPLPSIYGEIADD